MALLHYVCAILLWALVGGWCVPQNGSEAKGAHNASSGWCRFRSILGGTESLVSRQTLTLLYGVILFLNQHLAPGGGGAQDSAIIDVSPSSLNPDR